MTPELAAQAEAATIFGAPLSGTFMQAGDNWHIRVVTVVLIIAMSATTFLTQRQLTMKNMPPAALQGPMAQQQKVLLYVLPLIFAFSGVNFPIGVLIYWTTTNLWSMGQQFYTIRRMPAPGSQAEIAMKERKARKAKAHGVIEEDAAPVIIEEKPRGQREQPKRKDRNKPRPVIDEVTGQAGATARRRRLRRTQHSGARRTHQAKEVAHPRDDDRRENSMTSTQPDAVPVESTSTKRLEEEGEIAADYLEELLDIADLDGDIDIDIDHGRAAVEIVSEDPADRSLAAARRSRRRGARRSAGADPPRRPGQDRRAQPADARRRRLPVRAPRRAGEGGRGGHRDA